jgi:hypothetical protein
MSENQATPTDPPHLFLRLGHAGGKERLELGQLDGPWEGLTVGDLVVRVTTHLQATHRLLAPGSSAHAHGHDPPPLLRLVFGGRVISAPGMEEQLLHALGITSGVTLYATLSASPVTSPTETSAGTASALAAAGFGKGARDHKPPSPFGGLGEGRLGGMRWDASPFPRTPG